MILSTMLLIFISATACYAALSNQKYTSHADFWSVVKQSDFVDKTLFIKTMFEVPEKVLITSPRRNGKSMIIDMLRKFLEIQVNEDGIPVTRTQRAERAVNDTSNYKLFTSNQLKVMRHVTIMKKHFGKYPVLHSDFKCDYKITNSENAVFCFRQVIHNTFLEHKHLQKSDWLNTKERRFVQEWADEFRSYERFYGQDVTNSLYKLSILLYKHFGKEVMVLIDNYDHPSTSAMFKVKDSKELSRVVKFNMGIISKLLSADFKYIERAVIMGKTYLAAAGIHQLEDTMLCRFLGDHPFVEFFGLTEQEVQELLHKPVFQLDKDLKPFMNVMHRGYMSITGKLIYSLNPVLRFLNSGAIKLYDFMTGLLQNLKLFFKIHSVRENVEALINGNKIFLNLDDVITVVDIINYRNTIMKLRLQEHFNVNLVFYLLFEQGYLSYDQQLSEKQNDCNMTELRTPNLEIKSLFAITLKEYYDDVYKFDKTLLKKCSSFFQMISPALFRNNIQLKRALYWFYKPLEELISYTKRYSRTFSESDVQKLVFSILYGIHFGGNREFILDVNITEGRLDSVIVKDKFGIVIMLRPNCTSKSLLHSLINREQETVHKNKRVEELGVNKFIFIGLSVDEKLHPSVSCLISDKNLTDAVHIPETY